MKEIIIANRTNVRALSASKFESKDLYKNWKDASEKLRLAISAYAVSDRSGVANEESLSSCYDAYRSVLKFFEDKSEDFKLKPQAQDIQALRDIAGQYSKIKDSTTGKDFLPVSTISFRKGLEDFISDRCTNRLAKTAEEIESEKIAKREARKAERKAKKEAENKAA